MRVQSSILLMSIPGSHQHQGCVKAEWQHFLIMDFDSLRFYMLRFTSKSSSYLVVGRLCSAW